MHSMVTMAKHEQPQRELPTEVREGKRGQPHKGAAVQGARPKRSCKVEAPSLSNGLATHPVGMTQ